MGPKPRITLVKVEVDASWSSLAGALAVSAGLLGMAFWWVSG